jgi:hypothetical protein
MCSLIGAWGGVGEDDGVVFEGVVARWRRRLKSRKINPPQDLSVLRIRFPRPWPLMLMFKVR